MRDLEFDIIVLGGGIIGLSMVASLAIENPQLRLAIVEAKPAKLTIPEAIDFRSIAVTHASQKLWQDIGVWQKLDYSRVAEYQQMHVWDEGSDGQITFDANKYALGNLGHIIENQVCEVALWNHINSLDNVRLIQGSADGLAVNAYNAKITVAEQSLSAKLLIGADGSNSWLRGQAQINVKAQNYEHTAIALIVETQFAHKNTAWQRFLATGPLAYLPLFDKNLCSIVWSCIPKYAKQLMSMNDQEFAKEIATKFEHQLGAVQVKSKKFSIDLTKQQAVQHVVPRIALIGDAAHVIHPLAGQGANLGLKDVACLSQVINQAVQNNQDVGDYQLLRKYERQARYNSKMMHSGMDFFKNLFASNLSIVKFARGFGMQLADQLNSLKYHCCSRINY